MHKLARYSKISFIIITFPPRIDAVYARGNVERSCEEEQQLMRSDDGADEKLVGETSSW